LISEHKQKLNQTCVMHENKQHWFKRAAQHENERHWFLHIKQRCLLFITTDECYMYKSSNQFIL